MTFYDGEIRDLHKREPGWRAAMNPSPEIKCLPVDKQYHKTYWDHDKTRLHMYTTGFFASHIDNKIGITFDDLEGLSIRQ